MRLKKLMAIVITVATIMTPFNIYAEDVVPVSKEISETSYDLSGFTSQTTKYAIFTDALYQSYYENDIYYLFVPSSADLNNLTIHCNQGLTNSSNGSVNEVDSLISGSFVTNTRYYIIDGAGNTDTLIIKKSDLPCINISLNGVDLDTVHENGKSIKYTGNTVVLTDPTNSSNNLTQVGNVEFKGRGNSSWTQTNKKGYQIKFEKKQAVLGMTKAKKWILLANSSDPSLVRNATSFNLGKRLGMEETPDYAFVDLWINGEYRGNYMLCEKVEIGKGRVDLSDTGILFELDGLAESDDVYFKDYYGKTYSLKDPDYEDASQRFNEFKEDFFTLEEKIATNPKTNTGWEEITSLLDVESVIRYMLINDYVNNVDAVTTSNFWYQDEKGTKIYNGPIWDFDSANMGSHSDPSGFYYMRLLQIYNDLTMYSQFRNLYVNYYKDHLADFNAMYQDTLDLGNYLANSADMNYTRWQILGKYTDKGLYPVLSTYQENIDSYANWLLRQQSIFSCKRSCNYSIPVYRLFNTVTGEHLYTKNAAEKNHLASGSNWRYEGIGWYSPRESKNPVYRLFSLTTGEHFYTMSANEKNFLIKNGWRYEGIAWYSDSEEEVPVYRDCKPSQARFSHNYTSNLGEHLILTATSAWRNEGIGWYGCK